MTARTATKTSGVSAPTVEVESASPYPELIPDDPRDDVERIEPDPSAPILLESGMEIEVVPLKLRETMKLLKIITRGAGPVLETLMGDMDLNDPVKFAQTLAALIIMSIPEAENEVVEFLQSMVRPAGFDNMVQSEKIRDINILMNDLNNPELEDTITIIELVVRRESEDIRSLGKRLGGALKLAGAKGIKL